MDNFKRACPLLVLFTLSFAAGCAPPAAGDGDSTANLGGNKPAAMPSTPASPAKPGLSDVGGACNDLYDCVLPLRCRADRKVCDVAVVGQTVILDSVLGPVDAYGVELSLLKQDDLPPGSDPTALPSYTTLYHATNAGSWFEIYDVPTDGLYMFSALTTEFMAQGDTATMTYDELIAGNVYVVMKHYL